MKNILTIFIAIFVVSAVHSQPLKGDRINTQAGDLTIHPIIHGTFALEWNGIIIYNDPYGGAEKFEEIPDADLILITDIHGDHLDLKTLDALNTTKAIFIVPQAVADKMPESYKDQLILLANGEESEVKDIKIEAVPMYNLPEEEDSRHTKGRGNGYILTIGGKRIYISGDTEDIPEMRMLKDIDVAFVCMNLPYTMDVEQAASAVLEFKPKVVYPFHYRGKDGLADVDLFKSLVSKDPSIEVCLRDWY